MRRMQLAAGRTLNNRPGLTLVEVLMSLMVTGIGILGVIALLPLAFVRAVQATNLTNSTILRYNAESPINLDTTDLVYVYPYWQPNTAYAAGQIVVPLTGVGGNNHMFQVHTAGVSGASPPAWQFAPNTTTDNSVVWSDNGLHDHYIIDPLGAYALGAPFGNNPPTYNTGTGQITLPTIPLFAGGQNGVAFNPPAPPSPPPFSVNQLVTLPDSWVEIVRGPASSPTSTSVTLSGSDLNGVPQPQALGSPPPSVVSRAVMIDATGKNSQTRLLTSVNVATSTISWSANDPLIGSFTPASVRVESQEQRYTWMLTVLRTSSGQASVSATVFFHRTLTPNDEQIYFVNPAVGPPQPVANQFTVTYANTATVKYPNPVGQPPPHPFAKKGGFLFDVSYGQWYRILAVLNDNGSSQLDVILDQPRPPANSTPFGAVIMRGIVDVYPIGQK
jgi:hypothetical protein